MARDRTALTAASLHEHLKDAVFGPILERWREQVERGERTVDLIRDVDGRLKIQTTRIYRDDPSPLPQLTD